MRALAALLVLAGCSDDTGGGVNASTLWLANGTTETDVSLVETEPPPF